MRVEELRDSWKGEEVYIVGTGPSLRVFPLGYFDDKRTIGLNQAWRVLTCRVLLTAHPELVGDWELSRMGRLGFGREDLVVKGWKKPRNFTYDHPTYYVFATRPHHGPVEPDNPILFMGRGIHTTAMVLAYQMGASAIILVGCDMAELGDDHHAHEQHVRFCGVEPDDAYREYRDSARKVRRAIEEKGVPVLTLTPFVGVASAAEDYRIRLEEAGLDPLPKPEDVSPYIRQPDPIDASDR